MSKMFPSSYSGILCNERGIGLITAIFVIVVVGMFGTLIARYVTISAVTSAEDYHWAQALYSAQSAAQLAILYDDNGGIGARSITSVAGFAVSISSIVDGVQTSASRIVNNTRVHREIELHVSL